MAKKDAATDKGKAKKEPQKAKPKAVQKATPVEPKKSKEFYVDLLCAAISVSERGLDTICKAMQKEDPDFPSVWSFLRLFADNEDFAQRYARAKEQQADVLADQIIAISDDNTLDVAFRDDGTPYVNTEHIQRSKLRVDSRKWIASKLKPKKYGEKIQQEHTGTDGAPLLFEVVFGDN